MARNRPREIDPGSEHFDRYDIEVSAGDHTYRRRRDGKGCAGSRKRIAVFKMLKYLTASTHRQNRSTLLMSRVAKPKRRRSAGMIRRPATNGTPVQAANRGCATSLATRGRVKFMTPMRPPASDFLKSRPRGRSPILRPQGEQSKGVMQRDVSCRRMAQQYSLARCMKTR